MSTNVQTRVGSFVWHEHVSTDADKAQSFYTSLLGWGIEVWKPGEFDYPMIAANGAMHGGFWKAESAERPPHWVGHVMLEDVDAAAKRAGDLGGTIVTGPMDMPEVGRFALVQDPQGGIISAFRPEGSGEMGEGVFVWDELLSADADAAKGFYTEVFGWTAREMQGLMGPYTILQRAGEADTAGLMQKPAEMPGPSLWIPYLATDDVDASVEKATGLGATALFPATDVPNVGRIAALADPTGAKFGLFKPSA